MGFCFSPYKHKHAQNHRREYGVLLQGLSSTVFLPRWFDYGTYLPTAERREQIPHRWAPLPVCVCAWLCVCMHLCVFILYVCLSPEWVYLCARMSVYTDIHCACVCAFAIQCAAQECVCLPLPFPLILTCKPLCVKVWDVSSGVWLWGDLSSGNIQVWDPSLSVGLTSDGKDLACRLLTKPQLCMIQELSKRTPRRGRSFHTSDAVHVQLLYIFFHCSKTSTKYQ